MAVDPVVIRRILDMIERDRVIKSSMLLERIAAEVPDREITLDLARKAVASRYNGNVRRQRDDKGRPLILSVRRDDGWYVVANRAFGPTESELTRAHLVRQRKSLDNRIAYQERLLGALQERDSTVADLPAEVWEEVLSG